MGEFIYSIGLIMLGLLSGQILKLSVEKRLIHPSIPVDKHIKGLQNIILLGLNPLINMGAFWIVKIVDLKLIMVPVLAIAALTLGGALGLVVSKILALEKGKTGSMYVTSSFSNIGSFGGLICFVFFGEISYAFVSMYKLFEEFYYYTVGFPIAKFYGKSGDHGQNNKSKVLALILDPYIAAAFLSIIIGLSLNLIGVTRPAFYSTLNSILIPLTSFLLVTTVGFKMRVTAVRAYLKECLSVAMIKFILVPIIITSIAYFLGVGELNDGMVLKVILILTAMPPAFTALIPPQLYDLDIDLANSIWLFNTAALVVVIPILYIIQGML